MSEHDHLVVHYRNLRAELLPKLLGRVFHVTSQERYEAILRVGYVRSNQDGALGDTFPQSKISIARKRGFVCLFDLRNPSREALEWGLGCFYFLAPNPLGDYLAFLVLSPTAYSQMISWSDIRETLEIGAFHIPDIECWFPSDVPLAVIERVVFVRVIRPPYDPNSLEALLEASMR